MAKYLENILELPIPMQATLFLFNDDSDLSDNTRPAFRKMMFAGQTAAKKTIIHSLLLAFLCTFSFPLQGNGQNMCIVLLKLLVHVRERGVY